MTYNVFGGTLNLTQPQPLATCAAYYAAALYSSESVKRRKSSGSGPNAIKNFGAYMSPVTQQK